MSRAHGSARPPIDSSGDARLMNDILRRGAGEIDWSLQTIEVGSRVHILAACHCEECEAIRASTAAEHAGDAELFDKWDREDERERRAWHSETRSRITGKTA